PPRRPEQPHHAGTGADDRAAVRHRPGDPDPRTAPLKGATSLHMSRLISKILLAVLMIPAAGLIDLTSFILLKHGPGGGQQSTLIAGLLTCAFIDVYWFL